MNTTMSQVACMAGARRGKGRGFRAKREKQARSARGEKYENAIRALKTSRTNRQGFHWILFDSQAFGRCLAFAY